MAILSIVFTSLCGCSSTSKKTVGTIRGELLSTRKTNERLLSSIREVLAAEIGRTGELEVSLVDKKTYSMQEQRIYKKYRVDRTIKTGEQVEATSLLTASIILAPLAPIAVLDGFGDAIDRDKAMKEEQKYIKRLEQGEDDIVIQTGSFNGHITYSKKEDGTVTEYSEPKNDIRTSPAMNVPVSIVDQQGNPLGSMVRTNQAGVARIMLASSLAEAQRLTPRQVDIKVANETLARFQLTEDRLAAITNAAERKGMEPGKGVVLPPKVEAAVTVPSQEISAGNDVTITIRARNTGREPAYRLVATTESQLEPLNGLRFEFGMLEPGWDATVKQTATIPVRTDTAKARMTVKWEEYNQHTPNQTEYDILIVGLRRPRFSLSSRWLEDGSGASVGDGDGKAEPGESVDVYVQVSNIGLGEATEVAIDATLTDRALRFAGSRKPTTKQTLGSFVSGGVDEVRFSIPVPPTYSKEAIRLNVTATDDRLGVSEERLIVIPIDIS